MKNTPEKSHEEIAFDKETKEQLDRIESMLSDLISAIRENDIPPAISLVQSCKFQSTISDCNERIA